MKDVVKQLKKIHDEAQKVVLTTGHALHILNGGKKSSGRVLSQEARERIADAQRKRWAKVHRMQKKRA